MAALCLSPPNAVVYNKDAERAHFALEEKKKSVSGVPASGMRAAAARSCSSCPALIGVHR